MTTHIEVLDGGLSRAITDDMNPRLYRREYRCSGPCGGWLGEEDVLWAEHDGTLDTDTGVAWCLTCAPPEPLDDQDLDWPDDRTGPEVDENDFSHRGHPGHD